MPLFAQATINSVYEPKQRREAKRIVLGALLPPKRHCNNSRYSVMESSMGLGLPQRLLIPVEAYFDFICPWCYIGKRSLEGVMQKFQQQHPEVEFEVTWRPYYINPTFKSKYDKRQFILDALGGIQPKYDALMERICGAAAQQNIDMNLNGNFGSTRDAHKLVALALRRHGTTVQGRVVDYLFKAQFERGMDLFEEDCLVEAGIKAAGLSADDIRLELADDDAGKRIDREVEQARELKDIEAVPCVTVLGRFKVGGYQEANVFEELFDKIYAERLS